ncbi:MAG TPA: hypothetical protein VFS42_12080 [Burkholderiaceae bacterium]|nr:hypothetical protein [Burkholderiaceae bacterium]
MNIALPALVVFFLLLPGFVVRTRIKRVERLSLDYSPFGQVVTEAVVWACGLHLLWVTLLHLASSVSWRPDVVLKLFSTDSNAQAQAINTVAAQANLICLYFGSLLAFAYIGPWALRWLIERYRLDRSESKFSRLFRFSGAPWYYLLSGADFAENERPDLILISAVVSIAGEIFLYTGVLDDYFLNQDGDLDRLILTQVMRRPLSEDRKPEVQGRDLERFYRIDGDCFVLRYNEITTLNVEYLKLREDTAGSQA